MIKHTLSTAVLAAAAASQLGATQCGQITSDSGFDLWCGKDLCDWQLERGSITKVPTWNAGDPGVSLDGTDTAISQLTPVATSDGTCIEFDLIANVDETAQVELNVDIDGDGTVDTSEQIPTSNWQSLTYVISIVEPYSGVRFELTKRGSGDAVLALISAHIADPSECAGIAPVSFAAVDGAPCGSSTDCASGDCEFNGYCEDAGCGQSVCGSGDVCGAGSAYSATLEIPEQCVPAGQTPLGANCLYDFECASGICNGFGGFCSTCNESVPCAGAQTCGPAWSTGVLSPSVCSPNAGVRTTNEPCASDADCASGACHGELRKQCNDADGRACGSDGDCPFYGDVFGDDSMANEHTPCVTVGVQGGTCQ